MTVVDNENEQIERIHRYEDVKEQQNEKVYNEIIYPHITKCFVDPFIQDEILPKLDESFKLVFQWALKTGHYDSIKSCKESFILTNKVDHTGFDWDKKMDKDEKIRLITYREGIMEIPIVFEKFELTKPVMLRILTEAFGSYGITLEYDQEGFNFKSYYSC